MDEVKKQMDLPEKEVAVVSMDLANCGAQGYAKLKEKVPSIDLLINNAGVIDDSKQLEASPEQLEQIIKCNLYPITILSAYAKR